MDADELPEDESGTGFSPEKIGFPEQEKDQAPSAIAIEACKCIRKLCKKLDLILQRFTQEGVKLSSLQDQ